MSKNPPSHSREGERERKVRQRLSQPRVPTPPDTDEDVPPLVVTEDGGKLYAVTPTPQRTKGKTPEECGYPPGQVDVRIGPQGQKLWRLNGYYDMPNRILCFKA